MLATNSQAEKLVEKYAKEKAAEEQARVEAIKQQEAEERERKRREGRARMLGMASKFGSAGDTDI